jgi:hypothetical protein
MTAPRGKARNRFMRGSDGPPYRRDDDLRRAVMERATPAIAMEAASAGETAQHGSTGTATARADRHRPKGGTQ